MEPLAISINETAKALGVGRSVTTRLRPPYRR